MKKVIPTSAMFLLLVATAAWCRTNQISLQDLKTTAESAKTTDQPKLFIEIAERQLAAADKLYTAGQPDQAQAAINDVVTYSQKAAKAATDSGKHLKKTEIAVRKMSQRLKDMKPTVSFEDRQPVQNAIDQLQQVSEQLFNRMFSHH